MSQQELPPNAERLGGTPQYVSLVFDIYQKWIQYTWLRRYNQLVRSFLRERTPWH